MNNPIAAMTVMPGYPETVGMTRFDHPPGRGTLLVDGLLAGVCGTDREIVQHGLGYAPAGADRLVLGHESVGRVVSAPRSSEFAVGDLVAGLVRRPGPDPCPACRNGETDSCLDGRYQSRGISGLHGYGVTSWWLEPEFAVRLDPALGELGVLAEPASVVAKAWEQIGRIGARTPRGAERVLIIGAGPIGLLAALLSTQRGHETHVLDRVAGGAKPWLVQRLGAAYHAGPLGRLGLRPTIVLECSGASELAFAAIEHAAPGPIVCLIGLPDDRRSPADLTALARILVRGNGAVFGSVNAGRRHFEAGAAALSRADPAWLAALITRRFPLDDWPAALSQERDGIKTVVELAP
jgi:threonine dehydrogenase-like Zn-dependent dehydrogenase